MRVTIIGGGIIGLCTAYFLRKAGMEVTVIERNQVTDGCSFGNMGYISPSHFIPIATPGIISQGLRWMMSSTSPFYIKPRLDADLIRWGIAFWRKSNANMVSQNTPHLNNLLHLSRELMKEFRSTLPDSFDFIEKGCWMLYKNKKTGEHEKHLAEQAEKFGLKAIICDPSGVQSYEPNVEVNVAGGVLYLDDAHLDPAKWMQSLFSYLQKEGVKFWLNTEVTGFEFSNKKITSVITENNAMSCEEVVVANGSWLNAIAGKLGIKLLLQPGKGYSVVYNNLEKNLQYPSILVDHRTATAPIGKRLRIGGTMELSGHNTPTLPKRVMAIYNAFKLYYPTVDIQPPSPGKAWFGFRPVTPDGLPYLGRHPKFDNLTFAGGHAMLGVSAAAGTGMLVKEILQGKPTSVEISAFKPERFS